MNAEDLSEKPKRRRARPWVASFALPLFIMAAFVLRAFELQPAPRPATPSQSAPSLDYETVRLNFGRGHFGDGWRVYFNEPDAEAERATYQGGIEQALADAISETERNLDIAAFELNSEPIAAAIREAHLRGVAVRIVTDDEHGLEDASDPQLRDLRADGFAVVDDDRSGLMHNKFVIMDGQRVWTGSWNYTVNGSYRNNNNVVVLDSAQAAEAFKAEFDEMFIGREFGTRSSDDGIARVPIADGEVRIIFAAEADEVAALTAVIASAERSIRFMTFVFSLEELAVAMLQRVATHDVSLQGVFEKRSSTAAWSQLTALHCAGAAVRQDGNRYVLHHKVIIIDDDTVITGSFNFSNNAALSNDENIVIIRHAAIAALYLEEWGRIWDSAVELAPAAVSCD